MTIKKIDFCFKWFHIIRGIRIRQFVSLKIPKKIDLSKKKIGFHVDSWFWIGFFALLEVRDGLKKVIMMFCRCFGWNLILADKNQATQFFNHHSNQNLGTLEDVLFFFSDWIGTCDISSTPLSYKKKLVFVPFSLGPRVRPDLIPCFFLYCFRTLFICILKIIFKFVFRNL